MKPQIRDFVKVYAHKPLPEITVKEWIKQHNHEIWRTCQECDHVFDLRNELYFDRCPKCGSKNIK